MNKSTRLALIVGISVVVVGGIVLFLWLRFGSTDAHLRLIPREATAVAVINVRSLASKADLLKLADLPEFKKITSKSSISTPLKKLMENPMDNGVDITQSIAGFVDNSGGSFVVGMVFKINDDKLFSIKIPQAFGLPRPGKIDDMWFLPIEHNIGLAWDDNVGILMLTNEENSDNVAEKAAKLMKQPDQFTIQENESYSLFSKKEFDMGIWVDNAAMVQLQREAALAGRIPALSRVVTQTDGYSDFLINFEDQSIKMTGSNYSLNGEPSGNQLRKSPSPQEHFATFADKNPIGFINIALDMKNIMTDLKSNDDFSEAIKSIETGLGLSSDEFARLFTGDLSIAFTDYRDILAEDSIKQREALILREQIRQYARIQQRFNDAGLEDESFGLPENNWSPIFVVNLSITDTGKTALLLNKVRLVRQREGFWSTPSMTGLNMYAIIKDKHLVLTNSYTAASTVMQKGRLEGKPPKTIAINSSLSGWFDCDLSHYPQALTSEMKKEMGETNYQTLLKVLQPLTHISLENGKNGEVIMNINLKSGEGNSLYRLVAHEVKIAAAY